MRHRSPATRRTRTSPDPRTAPGFRAPVDGGWASVRGIRSCRGRRADATGGPARVTTGLFGRRVRGRHDRRAGLRRAAGCASRSSRRATCSSWRAGLGSEPRWLARTASSVTAVDAAPEMLARARARVGAAANVRFVLANVFSWRPGRRYDVVCFGFWISRRARGSVRVVLGAGRQGALAVDGRVFFFDDNDRPHAELAYGRESPIVQRRLDDGRTFEVVKMAWDAEGLEGRLRRLGWHRSPRPPVPSTGLPGLADDDRRRCADRRVRTLDDPVLSRRYRAGGAGVRVR